MNVFVLNIRQRYAHIAIGGLAEKPVNTGEIKDRMAVCQLHRTTDAYLLDYEMMMILNEVLIDQDVFVAGASVYMRGINERGGGIIGRPGIYERQGRRDSIVRLNEYFSLLAISGQGGIVCETGVLEKVYSQLGDLACNPWCTYMRADMEQSDFLWVSDGSGPGAQGFVAAGRSGRPLGAVRLF